MKGEIIYKLKSLVRGNTSVVVKWDGSINTEDINYPLKIEFEINEFLITIEDFFMHSNFQNKLISEIFQTTIYGDVKIVKRNKKRFNINRYEDKKGKLFIEGKKVFLKGKIVKIDKQNSLYLLHNVFINDFQCEHLWIDSIEKHNANSIIYQNRTIEFYYKENKLKLGIKKLN